MTFTLNYDTNKPALEPAKRFSFPIALGSGMSPLPPQRPKRPLSAYNIFFREERRILLQNLPSIRTQKKSWCYYSKRTPHGKIGFQDLAKQIGAKWKTTSPEDRRVYNELAKEDRKRYDEEMKAWESTIQKYEKNPVKQDEEEKEGNLPVEEDIVEEPIPISEREGENMSVNTSCINNILEESKNSPSANKMRDGEFQSLFLETAHLLCGSQMADGSSAAHSAVPSPTIPAGLQVPAPGFLPQASSQVAISAFLLNEELVAPFSSTQKLTSPPSVTPNSQFPVPLPRQKVAVPVYAPTTTQPKRMTNLLMPDPQNASQGNSMASTANFLIESSSRPAHSFGVDIDKTIPPSVPTAPVVAEPRPTAKAATVCIASSDSSTAKGEEAKADKNRVVDDPFAPTLSSDYGYTYDWLAKHMGEAETRFLVDTFEESLRF